MSLQKPQEVKDNDFKSKKWDEIVNGRKFTDSDIPTLELLCHWYAVVDKCKQDMNYDGDIQLVYENNMGDIKPLPQLSTLKQASAEIRALNKQLGINDESQNKDTQKKKASFATIKGKLNNVNKDKGASKLSASSN